MPAVPSPSDGTSPTGGKETPSLKHVGLGHTGSSKRGGVVDHVRQRNVGHRRKRLNKGGSYGVRLAHDMLAALPEARADVGGDENNVIAFHLDKVDADTSEHQLSPEKLQEAGTSTDAAAAAVAASAKPAAAGQRPASLSLPAEPLKQLYGPWLNFVNTDLEKNAWLGNILVMYHESREMPKIRIHNELDGSRWLEPTVLDKNVCSTGYTAVRYDITVSLHEKPTNALIDAADADDPQAQYARVHHMDTGSPAVSPGFSQEVTYVLDPEKFDTAAGTGAKRLDWSTEGTKTFNFHVAARDEPWHWSFYSCNGFGTDCKEPEERFDGIRPMWRDMLQVNAKRPLHVMVGGGDQIYQDDLFFHCQSLRQWLDIFDAYERESYEFSAAMKIEVERYYLMHYMAHFSQPVLGDAMAIIPGINIVDDHDIFDGFGSYPDALQSCPVFRGIGAIGLRFYLLFQHHTTTERACDDGFWGGSSGYNFVRQFGPRTAIFGQDGRFERTKQRVNDPKSWDLLFNEHLAKLPDTVEHLIFASGVPVSFPVLGVTEKVMQFMSTIRRWSGFRKLFRFSGMYKKLGLAFGEPSNLDDLVDHWNSDFHIDERNELIERFQKFSQERSIRVTMIAGDVHCAAVAQLRTQGEFNKETKHTYEVPPLQDYRLMYNIVSSAIGNQPPPKVVLKLFQWSSSRRPVKNVKNTTEGLVHVFQHDVDGKRNKKGHRKIMARRNWCEVDEIVSRHHIEDPTKPIANADAARVVEENAQQSVTSTPEVAIFRLRFEPPRNTLKIPIGVYHVSVPRLVVGHQREKQHPELVKMAESRHELGVGVSELDEREPSQTNLSGENSEQANKKTKVPELHDDDHTTGAPAGNDTDAQYAQPNPETIFDPETVEKLKQKEQNHHMLPLKSLTTAAHVQKPESNGTQSSFGTSGTDTTTTPNSTDAAANTNLNGYVSKGDALPGVPLTRQQPNAWPNRDAEAKADQADAKADGPHPFAANVSTQSLGTRVN